MLIYVYVCVHLYGAKPFSKGDWWPRLLSRSGQGKSLRTMKGGGIFRNQVRLGNRCVQTSSAAGEPTSSEMKGGRGANKRSWGTNEFQNQRRPGNQYVPKSSSVGEPICFKSRASGRKVPSLNVYARMNMHPWYPWCSYCP